jgi:hypothetical protein
MFYKPKRQCGSECKGDNLVGSANWAVNPLTVDAFKGARSRDAAILAASKPKAQASHEKHPKRLCVALYILDNLSFKRAPFK